MCKDLEGANLKLIEAIEESHNDKITGLMLQTKRPSSWRIPYWQEI